MFTQSISVDRRIRNAYIDLATKIVRERTGQQDGHKLFSLWVKLDENTRIRYTNSGLGYGVVVYVVGQ